MANILPREKRLDVLKALIDGNSERAVERMTGVSRPTIGAFALRVGTAAQSLHNSMAHGLVTPKIEQDEMWSYVGKKQARCTPADLAMGLGEAYIFVSFAMPSRYVITWTIGKRTQATAMAFEADTRARVVVMPEFATDGFAPYPLAIGAAFGPGADLTVLTKHYRSGGRRDDDHRYEPPRDPFLTKHPALGAPDVDAATTAHMERNNGTMRHLNGRLRRLCYAFSKSPEHHAAAVALCYVAYDLTWVPQVRGMRCTPAMAINATGHVWDAEELLDALLSVPETAAPVKVALAPRKPETTARELPNGRGFLRIVPGPAAPVAPFPAPAPETPPAAPAAPAPRAEPSKLLPPGQLSLFGIDLEPDPKKPQS